MTTQSNTTCTQEAAPHPRSRRCARLALAPPSARCAGLGGVAAAASDLQPVQQRGGRLVSHRTVRPAHRLAATSAVRGQYRAGAATRQGRHAGAARLPADARAAAQTWARLRRNTSASSPGRYASTACLWPPCACRPGRPLPSLPCRRLEPGELFLLSVTNPASFDSRYFGGQRIRRDRRCASGLAGDTPMMAADSLHVVVPLIVPSGMRSSGCPCRRACSAGAFAPHFALPSAQPSNAGVLPRTRSACGLHGVSSRRRALAAPQQQRRPPLPGAPAKGKGGRQDKRTRHQAASKASLGERSTERLRRRAAGARPAPMQACPRASRDRTRRSLRGARP